MREIVTFPKLFSACGAAKVRFSDDDDWYPCFDKALVQVISALNP
jgi:hypothetical protein